MVPEAPQRVVAVGFNDQDFALALGVKPVGDFANALGFSSPLSLPYALEHGVPRLEAALDGDPGTPVKPG